MSLPPGFLDELRSRLSLAQVVGRKVTWDTKKSNVAKGDNWAPCPFHQEKTASFHVDDRKGFYYCFGCHSKGDALNFIRETENVGFMEAVEILAREAGMTVPARDPKAREIADHQTQLAEVMEQAAQFFRLQLSTGLAADARAYLTKRGLSDETQTRFEIGFAADTRTALFAHLTAKNVDPALIIEAGLCIKPDDGGAPYDRFRGRIIFPIRDARGRCIAFGGRAMDPNARAKYLNSPETPLFDKGRSLFNHGPAREAAGKAGGVIVAEGYMDVIALAAAGLTNAVAPLGTAVTENQLQMIWRLAPEPIIALDGDEAGLRAAMRLIDLALPHLEPGRSLRFAMMPSGQDPDDVIRASGVAGINQLLEAAEPMVNLLWRRETDGKVFDSPERRAGLDASLRTALSKIRDASVQAHYKSALRDFRSTLFSTGRAKSDGRRSRTQATGTPSRGARTSYLGQGGTVARSDTFMREAIILAACLRHPEMIAKFDVALERLEIGSPDLRAIRDALMRSTAKDSETLRAETAAAVGSQAVEKLLTHRHVQAAPAIRTDATKTIVQMALAEEFAKIEADRGMTAEIEEAVLDMAGLVDEGLTWRIGQASEARDKAVRTSLPDDDDSDEDTGNLSRYLQDLIDDQVWVKKKR